MKTKTTLTLLAAVLAATAILHIAFGQWLMGIETAVCCILDILFILVFEDNDALRSENNRLRNYIRNLESIIER